MNCRPMEFLCIRDELDLVKLVAASCGACSMRVISAHTNPLILTSGQPKSTMRARAIPRFTGCSRHGNGVPQPRDLAAQR